MTPRTPAASGLDRWNWDHPCLMWRWEPFWEAPLVPGTASKADERRKDSCLDAENPMTPRILLALLSLAPRSSQSQSRWLRKREDISAETYISGSQP